MCVSMFPVSMIEIVLFKCSGNCIIGNVILKLK